jgi:hypothetical protein
MSHRFIFKTGVYEKGRAFPFYKDIIEGGNWSLLKPTSQAIYPVMRRYSFFDAILYQEQYSDSFNLQIDFIEDYMERQCDFCNADPEIIAEMAGISFRSYNAAFEDLIKHGFREVIDKSTFKVFLHPAHYYNREGLNAEIKRKYEKLSPAAEKNNSSHGAEIYSAINENRQL